MRVFRFVALFVSTVLIGGAALGASIALIVPAAHGYTKAVTPLGPLNIKLNQPAVRSEVFDRYGRVMTTLFDQDRAPVKLKDVPKDRVLLVETIYDTAQISHTDPKKKASWNCAFPDGHVVSVACPELYDSIAGGRAVGSKWSRMNDDVRVLELKADGRDPLSVANWGGDKFYPFVSVPY